MPLGKSVKRSPYDANSKMKINTVVWWLHPALLFAALNLFIAIAALSTSQATYEIWGTSKFFTTHHLLLVVAAVVSFCGAFALSSCFEPRVKLDANQEWVCYAFRLSAALAVFGYIAWVANAVVHGLNLGLIWEVLEGDRGATNNLKNNVFETIPGVTTFTQVGIAACAIYPTLRGATRIDSLMVGIVLALSFARAVLISERLAFVETIVPFTCSSMFFRLCRLQDRSRVFVGLVLPALGICLFFAFFAITEYFRSWQYYKLQFDSYPSFICWRLSSYYVTAVNNGAMWVDSVNQLPAPYFTFNFLWDFPLLPDSWSYPRLFGINPRRVNGELLNVLGTPELNNPSGNLMQVVDFGYLGFLIYWSVIGAASAKIYQSFRRQQIMGLFLMPIVFLMILESPRISYLSSTRLFPALAILLMTLIFAGQLKIPRCVGERVPV